MDMGGCTKTHSEILKHDYDESVKQGKDFGYFSDLQRFLEKLLDDVDRRIASAGKRIEEIEKTVLHLMSYNSSLILFKDETDSSAEIKSLMARAEALGTLA